MKRAFLLLMVVVFCVPFVLADDFDGVLRLTPGYAVPGCLQGSPNWRFRLILPGPPEFYAVSF